MKQILFILIFTALSFTGLQAQSKSEVITPELKVELIKSDEVSKETKENVAAKKKDILNNKISLKLKGEAGLFLVADKQVVC